MKKILTILLIAFSLGLTACKEEKKEISNDNFKVLETQITTLQAQTQRQIKSLHTILKLQQEQIKRLVKEDKAAAKHEQKETKEEKAAKPNKKDEQKKETKSE